MGLLFSSVGSRTDELGSRQAVLGEVRRQVDVQVDPVDAAPHTALPHFRERPRAGRRRRRGARRGGGGVGRAAGAVAAEPAAAVAAGAERGDCGGEGGLRGLKKEVEVACRLELTATSRVGGCRGSWKRKRVLGLARRGCVARRRAAAGLPDASERRAERWLGGSVQAHQRRAQVRWVEHSVDKKDYLDFGVVLRGFGGARCGDMHQYEP